jgi:hypothetical protein
VLSYNYLRSQGDRPMVSSRSQVGLGLWYPAASEVAPPGPWRTLRARVTGGTFTLEWGGQQLSAEPSAFRDQWLARHPNERPEAAGLQVELPARGAIGLYLHGGSLSVRRFRVQPLAAAPAG